MAFWDEKKVKCRVAKEKESNNGLLYSSNNVVEPSSNKFNIQHMLSHPEIKRSYERTVSRVMAVINEEYMLLQSSLMEEKENAGGVEDRSGDNVGDEENTSDEEAEEVSHSSHGSNKPVDLKKLKDMRIKVYKRKNTTNLRGQKLKKALAINMRGKHR